MNSETKNCQNCKNPFIVEPDDFSFYEKMKVPPPTFCPRCRLIRRLAWVGDRSLYKRKCDFSGDMVISSHHPDSPHKVYRQDIWWSDKWDPKSYGRDYDFSRSFFEQFAELFKDVPLPALQTEYTTMFNSDYCNGAATLKNCYLCFKSDDSENCSYLNTITDMKECIDCSFSNHCELSYGSVNVNKCYGAFYSQDCEECQNIYFSTDMVGCSDCVGCVGLRKKSYYIFNEPYSKEEYEKKFKEFDFGSTKNVKEFQEKARVFALKYPRKSFHGRKITDSSGDYLLNSKNVKDSYMVMNGENIRYCQLLKAGDVAESYDYTMFALKAEMIYECVWTGINVNNIKFGWWDYKCHDLEYSFGCHGSGNLFGCVGVRSGEYCILNKQYPKEKYFELVAKIKEQMMQVPYKDAQGREYRYGEYFPVELCPWKYNETNAQEWFPLTKEHALAQGFAWRDPDAREYQEATMEIPDHVNDVKDDILEAILKCATCGKNYRIIKSELAFYRRFNIPVPHECPTCRDTNRRKRLNPIELYDRTCAKCNTPIRTSYAPDRPEIVYCETCYQAEVV